MICFSLEVNYISVMSTLIKSYPKNSVSTRSSGVITFVGAILSFSSGIIGECLSGAIRESDLVSHASTIGFTRPVLVAQDTIGVSNKDLEKLVGQILSLLFE